LATDRQEDLSDVIRKTNDTKKKMPPHSAQIQKHDDDGGWRCITSHQHHPSSIHFNFKMKPMIPATSSSSSSGMNHLVRRSL
jgi:hypothetical protein